MTTTEVVSRVRYKLQEEQLQGFFSDAQILDDLNQTFRVRVIPDLWKIGEYHYLYDLHITGELTLSASTRNGDWMEADLTTWVDGDEAQYVFYPHSLNAMVAGNEYRIPIRWVPLMSGYWLNYGLATHKPVVLGTLKGNTIYVYDDDYSTLYTEAVEIPKYSSGDTIGLDEYVIEAALIPAICSEGFVRDKGITMQNVFRREYVEGLSGLDMRTWQAPREVIPPRYGGRFGISD